MLPPRVASLGFGAWSSDLSLLAQKVRAVWVLLRVHQFQGKVGIEQSPLHLVVWQETHLMYGTPTSRAYLGAFTGNVHNGFAVLKTPSPKHPGPQDFPLSLKPPLVQATSHSLTKVPRRLARESHSHSSVGPKSTSCLLFSICSTFLHSSDITEQKTVVSLERTMSPKDRSRH